MQNQRTHEKKKVVYQKIQKYTCSGISKELRKQFSDVVEEVDAQLKGKSVEMKKEYQKCISKIEDIGLLANECYQLYLEDQCSMTVNFRDPFCIMNFIEHFMINIKEFKKKELQNKQIQLEDFKQKTLPHSQNNIYELLAQTNIHNFDLQAQIKKLNTQLSLSLKRTQVAEQMTQQIQKSSQEMLKVYRQNFSKIASLLKKAEDKQTQIIQSNRFLSQQIQTLTIEFEEYKKNYKMRTSNKENEEKMKNMMQKEFDEKLKIAVKQIQYQVKSTLSATCSIK